jgi:hypothetical protein
MIRPRHAAACRRSVHLAEQQIEQSKSHVPIIAFVRTSVQYQGRRWHCGVSAADLGPSISTASTAALGVVSSGRHIGRSSLEVDRVADD